MDHIYHSTETITIHPSTGPGVDHLSERRLMDCPDCHCTSLVVQPLLPCDTCKNMGFV